MNKKITIQYLYLDLDQCTRCQQTEENLNVAVGELENKFSEYLFSVELIHIDKIEKAQEYRFESSPTIRINGKDMPIKLVETKCIPCGEIAGSDVDCRVWEYKGEQYDSAPIKMIVDHVSGFIESNNNISTDNDKTFVLPSNIKEFFESKSKKQCCPSAKCGCSK